VFEPLDPVLMNIHRRLKGEFDPKGVFNIGRLYADW
jgi:glycolate oxidase FAD binding subunit